MCSHCHRFCFCFRCSPPPSETRSCNSLSALPRKWYQIRLPQTQGNNRIQHCVLCTSMTKNKSTAEKCVFIYRQFFDVEYSYSHFQLNCTVLESQWKDRVCHSELCEVVIDITCLGCALLIFCCANRPSGNQNVSPVCRFCLGFVNCLSDDDEVEALVQQDVNVWSETAYEQSARHRQTHRETAQSVELRCHSAILRKLYLTEIKQLMAVYSTLLYYRG